MRATSTPRRTGGYERRNFTLRAETASLLDRLPQAVNRSKLVDEAIRARIASLGRARLRKKLQEGYAARAARDLRIAGEWFEIDEESWQDAALAPRARR